MFKDMSADTYLSTAGIASHWPFGRGCYVSGDKGFVIWVGAHPSRHSRAGRRGGPSAHHVHAHGLGAQRGV